MELTITQELEPLPIHNLESGFETPIGLLNSNYKKVIKCNFNNYNSKSIFGIKRGVKSRRYQFTSSIETLLKVSVFVIILAVII
ncbi:hypothetical protein [Psychroserpens ponticola]|uniref:Uncharacterized protein n=1 Tax=Psychroserpens ponticola TaxID=2932268 RepID=A0ABY7RVD3_9FLAO|nr:hypothetical protein [Psychroserpens ponticola]WCO01088.1 hypothetical protein MUN68_013570 [Psychroserpens ponticola]